MLTLKPLTKIKLYQMSEATRLDHVRRDLVRRVQLDGRDELTIFKDAKSPQSIHIDNIVEFSLSHGSYSSNQLVADGEKQLVRRAVDSFDFLILTT